MIPNNGYLPNIQHALYHHPVASTYDVSRAEFIRNFVNGHYKVGEVYDLEDMLKTAARIYDFSIGKVAA